MARKALATLLLSSSTDAFMLSMRPSQLEMRSAPRSMRPASLERPLLSVQRPATFQARSSNVVAVSTLAGPLAIPTTTAIAAMAGLLAYIHQAYIFSLSYGLAMAFIGGAVLLASPASVLCTTHATLVLAYGVRLFAFLLWRQRFQPGYDGAARLKALDKTPPIQRTPVILSTAFFYSLLSAPLVFHLQAPPFVGLCAVVSKAGCALAAIGLVIEAVADQQKSLFKMRQRAKGELKALLTG